MGMKAYKYTEPVPAAGGSRRIRRATELLQARARFETWQEQFFYTHTDFGYTSSTNNC
jgi:hypothetical protein